jgi:hypothetical protein
MNGPLGTCWSGPERPSWGSWGGGGWHGKQFNGGSRGFHACIHTSGIVGHIICMAVHKGHIINTAHQILSCSSWWCSIHVPHIFHVFNLDLKLRIPVHKIVPHLLLVRSHGLQFLMSVACLSQFYIFSCKVFVYPSAMVMCQICCQIVNNFPCFHVIHINEADAVTCPSPFGLVQAMKELLRCSLLLERHDTICQ